MLDRACHCPFERGCSEAAAFSGGMGRGLDVGNIKTDHSRSLAKWELSLPDCEVGRGSG